jgi:hypothetical protein
MSRASFLAELINEENVPVEKTWWEFPCEEAQEMGECAFSLQIINHQPD